MTDEKKTNDTTPKADDEDSGVTVESTGTIAAAAKTAADDKKADDKADDDPKDEDGADGADADDEPKKKEGDADGSAKAKEDWDALPEGVRKRMARQSRRVREAEERAQNAEAVAQEALKKSAAKPADDDTLDPDDFNSYDDYLEAVDSKAKADPKKKTSQDDPKDDPKDDGPTETRNGDLYFKNSSVKVSDFTEAQAGLIETLETNDPDLWDNLKAARDIDVSPELAMSLAETENPVAIVRKLLSDKDLGTKLSKMSPFAQARELAKLEVKGEKRRDIPDAKERGKAEPIDAGKTGTGDPSRSYSEMSQREYEEAREKEKPQTSDYWA